MNSCTQDQACVHCAMAEPDPAGNALCSHWLIGRICSVFKPLSSQACRPWRLFGQCFCSDFWASFWNSISVTKIWPCKNTSVNAAIYLLFGRSSIDVGPWRAHGFAMIFIKCPVALPFLWPPVDSQNPQIIRTRNHVACTLARLCRVCCVGLQADKAAHEP